MAWVLCPLPHPIAMPCEVEVSCPDAAPDYSLKAYGSGIQTF